MRRRAAWPLLPALAAALACEITSPDRPAGYAFRSQPDNLVFHWNADRLPVRYWAEAKGALPDYVDEGIRLWEDRFLYGEFEGTRVTDSTAMQVRVEIQGSAPPAAPLTTAPPAAACDGRTTLTVGTDNRVALPIVVILRWFAGFTAEQVANCLARVTVHEIGHTLGLLQHSDQATDIMYGAPLGLVQVREPSLRDGASAQRLYHTTSDVTP